MPSERVRQSMLFIRKMERELGLSHGPLEAGEEDAVQGANYGGVNAEKTDLESISQVLQNLKPVSGVKHPIYRSDGLATETSSAAPKTKQRPRTRPPGEHNAPRKELRKKLVEIEPSSRTTPVFDRMVPLANVSTSAGDKTISSAAPADTNDNSASRQSPPVEIPPTKKIRLVSYDDSEEE